MLKNLNFKVDTFQGKKKILKIYFIKIPILVNIPIITGLYHKILKRFGLSHSIPESSKSATQNILKYQIELTEQFMFWNDFPKNIRKYLLKNVCKEAQRQEKNIVNKANISTFWIRLPYIGSKGKHLLKQCIRKVKRNCLITCPGCLKCDVGKADHCFHYKNRWIW